jgi:hypothetical protein
MNFTFKTLLVATGLVFGAAAQASVITFETASSTDGPQASASDYRDVVNAAMALPGAQSAVVGLFDNLSNQIVFGGSNQNIAYRSTVVFGAASSGTWDLRAGVDFGRGGAAFLDGVALDFKSTDMWWAGSYADASQSFQLNGLALSAGTHTLQLFGLEGCCDGWQQGQYSFNGSSFKTFATDDGMTAAAVPEPETYALMLGGLGAVALLARRRKMN